HFKREGVLLGVQRLLVDDRRGEGDGVGAGGEQVGRDVADRPVAARWPGRLGPAGRVAVHGREDDNALRGLYLEADQEVRDAAHDVVFQAQAKPVPAVDDPGHVSAGVEDLGPPEGYLLARVESRRPLPMALGLKALTEVV